MGNRASEKVCHDEHLTEEAHVCVFIKLLSSRRRLSLSEPLHVYITASSSSRSPSHLHHITSLSVSQPPFSFSLSDSRHRSRLRANEPKQPFTQKGSN